MNEIKEYQLLWAHSNDELSTKVNSMIAKKYQPYGSPSICFGRVFQPPQRTQTVPEKIDGVLFVQAVVKY